MVRAKNIVPCCIFHGVFNALAAFSSEAGQTIGYQVTVCAVLTVISLSYALYLWKKGTEQHIVKVPDAKVGDSG